MKRRLTLLEDREFQRGGKVTIGFLLVTFKAALRGGSETRTVPGINEFTTKRYRPPLQARLTHRDTVLASLKGAFGLDSRGPQRACRRLRRFRLPRATGSPHRHFCHPAGRSTKASHAAPELSDSSRPSFYSETGHVSLLVVVDVGSLKLGNTRAKTLAISSNKHGGQKVKVPRALDSDLSGQNASELCRC
jgi:hypothetical protein